MEKRVVFDFEVFFTNGGGIQGQDFRLDIDGDEISDQSLSDYIISDMRLLMAGKVNILNKHYITEPHKRGRADIPKEQYKIDLSHTIFDGLITYKGLPAPIICDYLSREQSKSFYEPGTAFQIGKIEMVSNTGTYLDCPFHRFEHDKDLSEVALEAFADLNAITINAENAPAVGKEYFTGKEI